MNSRAKPRRLAAEDRANLMAALAGRGFYVIGEVPRDEPRGQPGPGLPDHPGGASVEKRTQEPQGSADGS